jgi:hypothetical protein
MSHRYEPRERPRWEDDARHREERDVAEREGFARNAGDPRWGTGGLRVEENAYFEERAHRPLREEATVRGWPRGEAPARTPAAYAESESAHGPYVGVGPRGYRRSDERIREDVCERFAQHGQLDPSDVEVAVHQGEVLLTGSVATRAQKRLAEDIADRVFGVAEVHNHLRVQRAGETQTMPRGTPTTTNDLPRAHAHQQSGLGHR